MNELTRLAIKACILSSKAQWLRGLSHGVAAAVEHRTLPLRCDVATVIDVGAHKGQFGLFVRALYPTAEVHCFEPMAEPCTKLNQLFARDPLVRVYPVALGFATGVANLHVSSQSDSSSLLPITERQVARFPGTGPVAVRQVEVRKLDLLLDVDRLKRPLLLKMDVQGFELEVLKGAEAVLGRCSQLLVECSFEQFYEGQPLFHSIYEYLAQRGFVFRAANCSARDSFGGWLQADVLFDARS